MIVKDVTYCKNLLKKANGELHTAEAVYGRTLTLYLKMNRNVGLVNGD